MSASDKKAVRAGAHVPQPLVCAEGQLQAGLHVANSGVEQGDLLGTVCPFAYITL